MKLVIAVVLLAVPLSVVAQSPLKVLTLKKTSSEIVIDGAIDAAWGAADSVSDFIQLQPYAGKDPSRKTVAKVLTTDENLYCLMICYEDKIHIQERNPGFDGVPHAGLVRVIQIMVGQKMFAVQEQHPVQSAH